jgi:transcriptional regulator with XRE-family HTH domain
MIHCMELALEPERVMAWCARWRGFLGLSLKDIESYTGISAAKLSRAELGSARLNLSERFVLSDFLGRELQKVIAAGGRIFVPTPSGAVVSTSGEESQESSSQLGELRP